MKHPLLILILLLFTATAFSYQQRHFGKYKNVRRYFGDEFVLKSNFTFTYTCHSKTNKDVEFRDSSSGDFKMIGDTIFLTYMFNNHHPFMSDSPQDSLRWEIVDPYGYFGNRPQKLFWKGKKIYYINEITGKILKSKEYHLRLIK